MLEVVATDRAGNETVVTIAFALGLGVVEPQFDFALCAFEELVLASNTQISSSPPAAGGRGHVAAHASVSLSNNSLVQGGVVAGGNAIVH